MSLIDTFLPNKKNSSFEEQLKKIESIKHPKTFEEHMLNIETSKIKPQQVGSKLLDQLAFKIKDIPSPSLEELQKMPYKEYLLTDIWKEKARKVRKRDNNICQGCGCKNRPLDVHHKNWNMPRGQEFLFDLISLCRDCHNQIHELMKRKNVKNLEEGEIITNIDLNPTPFNEAKQIKKIYTEYTNKTDVSDPKNLESIVRDFIISFEVVFDNDWEHTKCSIEDNSSINGTFLNPKVDDESNNWCNRGLLLHSYRRLKKILEGNNFF